MAPAGANRVIDGGLIVGAGGALGGGAGATMGGGFAPTPGTTGNLNAGASPFQPNTGGGGGFAGSGGFTGSVGALGGGGFASASAQPVASNAGNFGSTPPSPFNGGATALAPLAPDPNVPNSEAWCAPSFGVGNIPDDPPPVAYIR